LGNEIKIGQLIDKRFEITARIDRGGMATVFKALDYQTQRAVVLKTPNGNIEASGAAPTHLAREVAALGKLDHPGIPKIIPVAEKSAPYVVMEYLEGETLHDILQRRGHLPVDDALGLVSRLCEIVEYVHQQGIVHGDLKPGNIVLSRDGAPHLIDFGIARIATAEPMMFGWFSRKMTGTVEYMAPEQLVGDRIDARTDIYSLGALLYETATGACPFPNDVSSATLRARTTGELRPPREIRADVSAQVEEIIFHAMAPRPSERYSSAAALKADLDSPESVEVTGRYRTPIKAIVWPKRLRIAAFALVAGALPFVLFFIFLFIFQRQATR
jgi:serine/threonine-protein kinase